MKNNILKITDLSFSFGKLNVLKKIDFEIEKGKIVAIMGGSGSGKTTLLKLIGGLLKPISGKVFFKDKNINQATHKQKIELRKNMGMLFQFGALFTDLNVFENVAFPIREHTNLSSESIKDLVSLKLEAVGLRGAKYLMPSELSGGMARRVALARTIALDPSLIMYDEPFTGLDPISVGIAANLIKKLNRAFGVTSIIVTHDVTSTLKIVDEVFFIFNGEIVGRGSPDEVIKSKNKSIKQFLRGDIDGPVKFHFPSKSISEDLTL